MKCHHPAVFACALLNSQPMGFYAPAQIVRDAREHGVEVRPADINQRLGLHAGAGRGPGFTLCASACGRSRVFAGRCRAAGRRRGWMRRAGTAHDVGAAPRLAAAALEPLAQADAWRLARARPPRGAVGGPGAGAGTAAAVRPDRRAGRAMSPRSPCPTCALGEHVVEDYASLSLSLKRHPLALLRGGAGADRAYCRPAVWRGAPWHEDVRRRPRPGPAAAGQRQRRGLHHAGGRDTASPT